MKVFDLILQTISVDVMADMLDKLDIGDTPFCKAAEEENGNITCDKDSCKQCIKEWLESESEDMPF